MEQLRLWLRGLTVQGFTNDGAAMTVSERISHVADRIEHAILNPGECSRIDTAVALVLHREPAAPSAVQIGEKRIEYPDSDADVFCRIYAHERNGGVQPHNAAATARNAVIAFRAGRV